MKLFNWKTSCRIKYHFANMCKKKQWLKILNKKKECDWAKRGVEIIAVDHLDPKRNGSNSTKPRHPPTRL